MGKIKLTEGKLNRLIAEVVSEVMKEGYAFGQSSMSKMDTGSWSMVANRYRKYAQEIDMFIREFDSFYFTLQQATQKLGLVLVNEDNLGMDEDSPMRGERISYSFTDGTNPRIFYNNEGGYDAYCKKIERLGTELEGYLNPDEYKAMRVEVRYDEEITVDVEFGLWE